MKSITDKMKLHWANAWDEKDQQEKLHTICAVCDLETYNSVTRDDLMVMLRWLSKETIEVDQKGEGSL